jgi:hypothetical protein
MGIGPERPVTQADSVPSSAVRRLVLSAPCPVRPRQGRQGERRRSPQAAKTLRGRCYARMNGGEWNALAEWKRPVKALIVVSGGGFQSRAWIPGSLSRIFCTAVAS